MFIVILNLISNLDSFYLKFYSYVYLHWIFSLDDSSRLLMFASEFVKGRNKRRNR